MNRSSRFKQFVTAFALFTLVLSIPVLAMGLLISYDGFQLVVAGFAYAGLITLVAGLALAFTFHGSHMAFMLALAGGTFGKLILAAAYVVVLIKQFPQYMAISITAFLLSYLLFTGFEVYHLIRNLRPHFKKDS